MIYLILLIGLFLRLIDLNRSLWFTEASNLLIATQPVRAIPELLPKYFGPLFFFFLHYWLKLGIRAEWFLRIPNVILGLATIYLLFLVISFISTKAHLKFRQYKISLSLVLAFFLALNPLHIHYSQLVEPYSLIFFLSVASWCLILKYLKDVSNKTLSLFWFITFLNFLCFYLTVFNLLLQFAYVFLYHRKLHPRFLIYSLIAIILFSANVFTIMVPSFKEDWRGALNYVKDRQVTEDAQVIFVSHTGFAPVIWYQPELEYIAPLNDLGNDPALLDLRLSQGAVGRKDIYYFHYLAKQYDPNENIITWLSNAGYTLTDMINFEGIGQIDHYSFKN